MLKTHKKGVKKPKLSTIVNKIVKKWSKVVKIVDLLFFYIYNLITLKKEEREMLIGTYRHQLDEKSRFRMPSKFKDSLKEGFIVSKGTNGCLFAFSKEQFEKLYEKLENVSMFDLEAQKPIRQIMSSAFETEEDKQGRILLSPELRNYAKFNKNIVTIGVGNRVEIWAEEVFEAYNSNLNLDEAASSLTKYGV